MLSAFEVDDSDDRMRGELQSIPYSSGVEEELIAQNEECPLEWFHLACARTHDPAARQVVV